MCWSGLRLIKRRTRGGGWNRVFAVGNLFENKRRRSSPERWIVGGEGRLEDKEESGGRGLG